MQSLKDWFASEDRNQEALRRMKENEKETVYDL